MKVAANRVALVLAIVGALIIGWPVILVGLWIGGAKWQDAHPKRGEKVRSVEWLPEFAKDISYYRANSFTAFEFDATEGEFRKWAEDREYPYALEEISDPVKIRRYTWMEFWNSAREENWEVYKTEEKKHVAVIAAGLYASRRQSNGGGYELAFDREASRVYMESSPR